MGEAMRDALFTPFTQQSGITVKDRAWDGRLGTLENQARSGTPPDATLLLTDNAVVLAACREGLLLPLDTTALPGLGAADGARPANGAARSCGLGAVRTGLVLAWDRSRVDGVPNWGDFWDVARRPGKRGLRRDPRGTLEIALMADGVAPGDVYRVLGTADGLDRAFRKLDQIKPYLVWWNTPAEAVQLIETGAVLMTSAPNGAVAVADQAGHRDFGVQWRGSLSTLSSWAMPGTPAPNGAAPVPAGNEDAEGRRRTALRLLDFALDPARQAALLARFPGGGVLGPTAAANAPETAGGRENDDTAVAQHLLRDALKEDDAFWAAHLDAIRGRFDAWSGS